MAQAPIPRPVILMLLAAIAVIGVAVYLAQPRIECDTSGHSRLNGVLVTPPPDWMQPIAGPCRRTSSQLSIRTDTLPGGAVFIEGALNFVQVIGPDGRSIVYQSPEGNEHSTRLQAGHYQVLAWKRPCGGSCDFLDPPTSQCSTEIDVLADDAISVWVKWRGVDPCEITWEREINGA